MPKPRKMLSDYNTPYIQSLMKLIETQSKPTLAHWAINYAEAELLPLYKETYPADTRPEEALNAARRWLSSEIKLPEAKPIILACHGAARDADPNPIAQASARAIGQCASTIHSPRHCIGLAFYGALALAYHELGIDAPWDDLEAFAGAECERMRKALEDVAVPDEPNPAKISWTC